MHSTENKEDLVNTERGLTRKMSSLKSFYNYFFRNERIKTNPAALVKLPKLHEKEIIRLEIDEVARLFEVDVLFLTVVFKDAERPVGTDFAAGKVDVFAGFGIAENDAG